MGKILCLLFCLLLSNLVTTYSQPCQNYVFTTNQVFTTCVSLPVLNLHLHWNYHTNGTVDMAFRHTGSTTNQWVAWAINIGGSGMIGSQSLVALVSSDGSVQGYTSPVTSYGTGLQPGSLSFEVSRITFERVDEVVVIYATLVLPSGETKFNQVWQVGRVINGAPSIHEMSSANRNAVGFVDFSTGLTIEGGGVGGSRTRGRNTHGVLNAVSWGILLPVGAMVARYLKVFKVGNPTWFYIHAACRGESIVYLDSPLAACQTAAYSAGVAGFITGLILGRDSTGIKYNTHRNIGITLFALGTIQVFALFLRPKPDHKYRLYWNIYHQTIGYTVIILSVINVYEGIDILDPEKTWKKTYTGIIISLGVITLVLEALTWFIVLKKKKDDKRINAGTNGSSEERV